MEQNRSNPLCIKRLGVFPCCANYGTTREHYFSLTIERCALLSFLLSNSLGSNI